MADLIACFAEADALNDQFSDHIKTKSVVKVLAARLVLAVLTAVAASGGFQYWYPLQGIPVWRQLLLRGVVVLFYLAMFHPPVEMAASTLAMHSMAQAEAEALKFQET